MSSRAPTPADGSPADHGRHGGEHGSPEGSAALAALTAPSPAARAAALARALPRMLLTVLRHPAWRGLGRTLVRLALALAAVALVGGLLIRFALWPQASAAREWLEERGSIELAAKVTIGGLDTYWDGWHPAFRARDVRAVDKEQRVLFAAGALDGKLSWRSLVGMNLKFVSLSAAQTDLLVRRTPDGRLLVAGMPVAPANNRPDDDRFLHWLMDQGNLDLSGGKLRWLDEKNRLPQLDVAEIQFQARRDGARHTITLRAESAALAPQPLVVRANFRHDYLHEAGDWRHWNGSANWDLAQLQLPVVQRYLAIFDNVASGTFSTDGTIEFRAGRITRSQTRLRASRVDLQLTGAEEPLRLANAQAFLLHNSDRNGNNQLTVDTLLWQPQPAEGPPASAAANAPEGAWREGMRKVTMQWAQDGKGQLRKFALKAPTFDLNTVRALASSLPVDTAVLRQLRALQPAGHIDNLDLNWSRDRAGMLERDGRAHYTVQGTLRGVSVNGQPANPAVGANGKPQPGVPGFARLSGSFSFDDQQGSARFEGNGASMTFPGVFEEPRVPFDQITGEVRWTHEDGKLVVRIPGVQFANADTAGTVRGTWRQGGDNASGLADLTGELTRAQVARVPRYLPLGLPAGTRHYLAGALAGGEAADVKFLLKGDLAHFPFHPPFEKAGDFRVEVPIQGVSYQIAPDAGGDATWPLFTDIAGQVLFERGGMSFLAKRASVHGIPGVTLQDVAGQIDDLSDHGRLAIDGGAEGPVQGFLRYIAASPVRGWTGQVTDEARGAGNGELKLKLDMPLTHANAAKVDGKFRFPGNDVTLMPQLPLLGGASGVVAFNEHGFTLENMRARFLGGETRIAGGTQADGTVSVTSRGTITAAGIREGFAGTPMARLGARLDGSTAYQATIGVREHRVQVQVGSELAGMAVNLPAPLAKAAAQEMPLRFDLRPATQGRAAAAEEMLVQYGNALNARYMLRRGANGLEVQAGGIGLLQPAPQPASGVAATLALERFDLDAWRATLADLGAPAKDADGPPSPYLPERLTAKARVLRAFGRDLDEVALDAAREATGWNFQLESSQIAGAAQWRKDVTNPTGALRLRLSRLNIPDANDAGNMADAIASNIEELPAIDLVADQFMLRGRDFGKLEVQAHTSRTDGEPVWTLDKLMIEQPGATLTGNGTWRLPRRLRESANAERRTRLDFQLAIRDAGNVLDRMGLPHTLRDGSGTLEGRVAWRGSPLSIDYPTLSGRLSLKLDNGQILSVDPGAARLLGVLSLQGLLRIATLDFRSLSGEGLVFDNVSGDGTIRNGVGTIEDFRLKSGQLMASMTGTTDLLRETQDLHVAVVPRINATTTSVAAAFINPVLGIGTLAAQLLFADEFSKVFTQRYRITGAWATPHIAKVEENKPQPPATQPRPDAAVPR